jgi:hypothetical protein
LTAGEIPAIAAPIVAAQTGCQSRRVKAGTTAGNSVVPAGVAGVIIHQTRLPEPKMLPLSPCPRFQKSAVGLGGNGLHYENRYQKYGPCPPATWAARWRSRNR